MMQDLNGSKKLEQLLASLSKQKDLLSFLEKRMQINCEKISTIEFKNLGFAMDIETQEALNEMRINNIRTQAEVITLKGIIEEKQKYFENYAKQFAIDLRVANLNWDVIVNKAKALVTKNKEVAIYLDALNKVEDIHADVDKKVLLFKRLKPLVDGGL